MRKSLTVLALIAGVAFVGQDGGRAGEARTVASSHIGAWYVIDQSDAFEAHSRIGTVLMGEPSLFIDCVDRITASIGVPIVSAKYTGRPTQILLKIDDAPAIPLPTSDATAKHIFSAPVDPALLLKIADAKRVGVRIKGTKEDADFYWPVNDGRPETALAGGKKAIERLCPAELYEPE